MTVTDPRSAERERRYRILWVTPELLMGTLLSPRRRPDGYIDVVKVDGIPEDCEVAAVCYSDERHAFGLRLWHPSFDVVEPCDSAPAANATCSVETLRVVEEPTRQYLGTTATTGGPADSGGVLIPDDLAPALTLLQEHGQIPVPKKDEEKPAERASRRGYEFL